MKAPPELDADIRRWVNESYGWICECGQVCDPVSPDWRWDGRSWQHSHGYPIGHVTAEFNPMKYTESLCDSIVQECERHEQESTSEDEKLWMRAYAAGARRIVHDLQFHPPASNEAPPAHAHRPPGKGLATGGTRPPRSESAPPLESSPDDHISHTGKMVLSPPPRHRD